MIWLKFRRLSTRLHHHRRRRRHIHRRSTISHHHSLRCHRRWIAVPSDDHAGVRGARRHGDAGRRRLAGLAVRIFDGPRTEMGVLYDGVGEAGDDGPHDDDGGGGDGDGGGGRRWNPRARAEMLQPDDVDGS